MYYVNPTEYKKEYHIRPDLTLTDVYRLALAIAKNSNSISLTLGGPRSSVVSGNDFNLRLTQHMNRIKVVSTGMNLSLIQARPDNYIIPHTYVSSHRMRVSDDELNSVAKSILSRILSKAKLDFEVTKKISDDVKALPWL